MGKRQANCKSIRIIREIESHGGINMTYVYKMAREEGRKPVHYLARWVRENYPVADTAAHNVAQYFIDKKNGRKRKEGEYYRLYPLPPVRERKKQIDKRPNIPDGWHRINFVQMYCEGHKVLYGISPETGNRVYPYHKLKGIWKLDQTMSVPAFRNGMRTGIVELREGEQE